MTMIRVNHDDLSEAVREALDELIVLIQIGHRDWLHVQITLDNAQVEGGCEPDIRAIVPTEYVEPTEEAG